MPQLTKLIVLDFRSGLPIYVQIVEQVQRLLSSGALRPGEQLPTVRQLATELRINFNTVARAYRLLDEAGVISTQQGRGTYIWEQAAETDLKQLRRSSLENLARSYAGGAAQLGYTPAEALVELQRILETNKPIPGADQDGINKQV